MSTTPFAAPVGNDVREGFTKNGTKETPSSCCVSAPASESCAIVGYMSTSSAKPTHILPREAAYCGARMTAASKRHTSETTRNEKAATKVTLSTHSAGLVHLVQNSCTCVSQHIERVGTATIMFRSALTPGNRIEGADRARTCATNCVRPAANLNCEKGKGHKSVLDAYATALHPATRRSRHDCSP